MNKAVNSRDTFQLSDASDPDKVFLVNLSDIEGRIDPLPFHPIRTDAVRRLERAKPTIKLSKAVHFLKSTIGESDLPYVGLENIESNTGKYIVTQEKSNFGTANKFSKNNILFSKLRPYLNKIHLAEFDGVCSTEFHVLEAKPEYSNEFLALYLRSNLILNQTKYLMTGNTLPRLQTQDILNLPVPVIDLETQLSIVNSYSQQMVERDDKLEKSDNLLNSINDYLLSKLEISIPEVDNRLENRIFTVQASQLHSTYDPSILHYEKQKMSEGKFVNKPLAALVNFYKGTSITSEAVESGAYPVIAGGQTSPYTHNVYNFSGQTITVSSSGAYSGYVQYHDERIFASDCIVLKSIDVQTYATRFIYEILKLKQQEIYRLQRGAGQPHVYIKDLKAVKIPQPSPELQQEIVNHIDHIRATAARLQQEADEILKNAKEQIENIITGSDG